MAIDIISIDRMTRERLRGIPYDQEQAFTLPAARDLLNASSLAYKSQYLMDCRFRIRCDFERNIIRITRRRKEADHGADA